MKKPMPNFIFHMMRASFGLRDFLYPRKKILDELGIKSGHSILDFGCGTGVYSLLAAEYVGEKGKVYALDAHLLSVSHVQKKAEQKGLKNIQTIHSNEHTALQDGSIDMVFLYDIFHMLKDPENVLLELHRVLKPGSHLSFSDHHMKEKDFLPRVTEGGMFEPVKRNKKTYEFMKK